MPGFICIMQRVYVWLSWWRKWYYSIFVPNFLVQIPGSPDRNWKFGSVLSFPLVVCPSKPSMVFRSSSLPPLWFLLYLFLSGSCFTCSSLVLWFPFVWVVVCVESYWTFQGRKNVSVLTVKFPWTLVFIFVLPFISWNEFSHLCLLAPK